MIPFVILVVQNSTLRDFHCWALLMVFLHFTETRKHMSPEDPWWHMIPATADERKRIMPFMLVTGIPVLWLHVEPMWLCYLCCLAALLGAFWIFEPNKEDKEGYARAIKGWQLSEKKTQPRRPPPRKQ